MRCRRSTSSIPSSAARLARLAVAELLEVELGPARLGRASSSLGRGAEQHEGPFANAAMYSTRSSIVGSAQ